jgi:hypothetical protein
MLLAPAPSKIFWARRASSLSARFRDPSVDNNGATVLIAGSACEEANPQLLLACRNMNKVMEKSNSKVTITKLSRRLAPSCDVPYIDSPPR